jgi:hypothetical protein
MTMKIWLDVAIIAMAISIGLPDQLGLGLVFCLLALA